MHLKDQGFKSGRAVRSMTISLAGLATGADGKSMWVVRIGPANSCWAKNGELKQCSGQHTQGPQNEANECSPPWCLMEKRPHNYGLEKQQRGD